MSALSEQIDDIVSKCEAAMADEDFKIDDFGPKSLSLYIWKDENFNKESGEFNLINIAVYKNRTLLGDDLGVHIDDLEAVLYLISDGSRVLSNYGCFEIYEITVNEAINKLVPGKNEIERE